jgi:hypothetical protein
MTLEELMSLLKMMMVAFPGWIKTVDADTTKREDLWGKDVIHIVSADGSEIWIQEAAGDL